MRLHDPLFLTLAALLLASPLGAQGGANSAPMLWQDRGDAARLNLLAGPAGPAGEPGTDFRFLEESASGTSPKFNVEDERGVQWKVKLGEEGRSETAAARLLWAAGYFVDEDYYRAQIRVRGMKPLERGQEFVAADGTVSGARLERATDDTAVKTWSWYENPFIGGREFNGLRVMMALINNWDLKEINNSESGAAAGRATYGISDLGATFGRTGHYLTRSKGIAQEYADSRFVDSVSGDQVDFVIHSRPFFPTIFNFGNYQFRTRMESIARDVPIADAAWIGGRLAQLSATQIGDCFRAGGFSPSEVDAFTAVVVRRIAALQALRAEPIAGVDSIASEAGARRKDADRQVPLRESLTAFPLGTPYFRGVFGGFEQGGGIGGGVQLTTAAALPAVELRATALTSTHLYQRYDAGALFASIAGGRTHAEAWFSYLQRDTDFFGVGRDTAADAETQFAIVRKSYQASLYRDLAEHLQGGIYTQLMQAESELGAGVSRSEILSYGGFLAFDTRDNSIGLTRGVSLYGRVASADGIRELAGAPRRGWLETEIDLRGYAPLGSPRTSLLLRSRAQLKSPRADAEIPYYELSWLGGRSYLRGTPSYRYRANNVLLLAGELQQTVVAITWVRGVDLFASADTGQAWSSRSDFTRDGWRSGLGGGVQYRHSRSIAARIELSRGGEGTVTYLSLSRGF